MNHEKDIHIRIFDQVSLNPGKIALTCGPKKYSYKDLWNLSHEISERLSASGLGQGDVLGIHLDRSGALVATMVACYSLGIVYVPIDPNFPDDRKRYLLENSEAKAVVTEKSAFIHTSKIPVIEVFSEIDSGKGDFTRPHPEIDKDRLAYIYYTSGSTGQPKGVCVSRSNIITFIDSFSHTPGMEAHHKVLAATNITFDPCFVELILPLTVGAQIVLADVNEFGNPEKIAELISQCGINYVQATPTMWRMLLESGWQGGSSIRGLSGGEPLDQPLASRLLPKLGELWNVYGPTEATIWCSAHKVCEGDKTIFIGEAIEGCSIEIQGLDGKAVPLGDEGEIVITGALVAKGYKNLPDVTKKVFSVNGERQSYRTGDFGAFTSDGLLRCSGRKDQQVKISGQRIELGEIENALVSCSEIVQAVCFVYESTNEAKKIAACVVPRQGNLNKNQVLSHLRQSLIKGMIPSRLVEMDKLPVTASGKLDRTAIKQHWNQVFKAELANVNTSNKNLSQLVSFLWKKSLGDIEIGPGDNFFQLGGSSLDCIIFMKDLKEATGIKLTGADVALNSFATLLEIVGENNTVAAPENLQKMEFKGLFFGENLGLYGSLFTPPPTSEKTISVLMCPPDPREQMCCRWAYKQIASQLLKLGCQVFRFDYSGTGDSFGDSSYNNWVLDIVEAYRFLKSQGLGEVQLFGARMGASLALSVAHLIENPRLLLWDPVWKGSDYLKQSILLEKQRVREYSGDGRFFTRSKSSTSVLGQPLYPQDRHYLEDLDISKVLKNYSDQISIIESDHDLARSEDSLWENTKVIKVQAPSIWDHYTKSSTVMFPSKVIDALTTEFSNEH